MCREYGWTPEYILKKLTWGQVWMYYEHACAWIAGKDVDYDEEPPPLEMTGVQVTKEGHRVYNR